jgi:hypothetical protein
MGKINDQDVSDTLVELALEEEEEGVDTAVVAFFDVGFVRTEERNAFGEGALKRSVDRRRVDPPFLKR